MFKITQNKTYKWPVEVRYPQDGGTFGKATFTAEFKALPQSEIEKVIRAGREGDETADICSAALMGFTSVQDENGNDLPYSEENKARLLDVSAARAAILTAFFESVSGDGARRKNSQGPR